jgi:hypothetical protein
MPARSISLARPETENGALITEQRVRAGCPAFGSSQMKIAGLELDIAPLELTEL